VWQLSPSTSFLRNFSASIGFKVRSWKDRVVSNDNKGLISWQQYPRGVSVGSRGGNGPGSGGLGGGNSPGGSSLGGGLGGGLGGSGGGSGGRGGFRSSLALA
jgi:hypothetical protein